jgi:LDH2 family malate/lactate/ureidoglycolate dehydrogenase
MPQRFPADQLETYATNVLRKAGLDPQEAAWSGHSLVLADMRGVGSHGLMRLRTYARRTQCGVVKCGVTPKIIRESPAFLLVDADNGTGLSVGMQVMQLCIDRAGKSGACFATVFNANHFGIAAAFAELAVKHGMIGIAMSNAPATMVPWGGKQLLLGANPVSIAMPAGKHLPLVLDMATSSVARGKIILAAKEGKKEIPGDWALDSDGRPTTDPQKALDGAMLPFGGAKGYSLALIIDILSACLSGAMTSLHINNFWEDFEHPQKLGFFLGALNIEALVPLSVFNQRMEALIQEVKTCPPSVGNTEVFYPGEPEHRREADSRKNGIPLGPATAEDLRKVGEEYGVAFPTACG